ncbi:MAG TPA: class F sortase [Sporichthyaceae bacterium]|jgi:hypothetical protein
MQSRVAARAAAVVVPIVALAVVVVRSQGGSTAIAETPLPTPSPMPTCSTALGALLPTSVSIPGVNNKITVLPLPRDSHNVPGTPPLTNLGKTEMAFDLGSGIKPGDSSGNALLNAHTWPDGSALGNKLLAKLQKGDQIVVHGALGQVCYRVNDRVEVPADDNGKRYFATSGQPQIALIVCSGKRIGPGDWTMRTIWYASPIA